MVSISFFRLFNAFIIILLSNNEAANLSASNSLFLENALTTKFAKNNITETTINLIKVMVKYATQSTLSLNSASIFIMDNGMLIPNSSPKCDTLQFKRLASFLQKPWLAA